MAIPTPLMRAPFVLILSVLLLCLLCSAATVAAVAGDKGNALFNMYTDGLRAGESLINGSFRLTMEHDCDLFLYKNNVPIWTSDTYRSSGVCQLKVTPNGTLAIYHTDTAGKISVIWSCGTPTNADTYALLLGGDGSFGIYGPSLGSAILGGIFVHPLPLGYRNHGILYPTSKRGSGRILISDRGYELLMDHKCRLVIKHTNGEVVWVSNNPDHEIKGKCYFEFTTDGELVTSELVTKDIGNGIKDEYRIRLWGSNITSNAFYHISALPDLPVLGFKQTIFIYGAPKSAACGKPPINIAIS